ncbi:MAG: Ig-like domain repeat protein [Methanobacteriaceae archaeon]|nr:Ig-like domain repeat protein [Methanobacteriaceae archaeon]
MLIQIVYITNGRSFTSNGKGNTITINSQNVKIESNGELTLKNITFKSNNQINGSFITNNQKSILSIEETTINNMEVTGNGIIYNEGELKITNSTLSNNKANNGGAIYGSGNIINCTLTNNTAKEGGAIFGGNNNIINSNFTNNNATMLGGAINGGNNNITGSTFVNNTVTDSGGAIWITEGIIVNQSVFVNNNATNSKEIFVKDMVPSNISLDGNWWGNNDPEWNILLSGTDYPNNHVVMNFTNVTNYRNGNISLVVSLNTLDDTDSVVSTLPLRQALFSSTGGGSFTNNGTYFTGNMSSVYLGNAGMLYAYIDDQILNLTLKVVDNSFTALETLINTSNGTVTLTRDYVRADNEIDYINGIIINKNITINGNKHIINGTSPNKTNIGRIFQIENNISLTLNNITLTGGNYTGDGGAIENKGRLTINNTILMQNYATGYGGAIHGNNVNIINTTFINNSVKAWGGALSGVNNTITDSNFINNSAVDGGGSILGNKNFIVSSNFTNNIAEYGGAIWIIEGDISGSNFINNNATEGGVISSRNSNITDSMFIDNTAEYGGVIFGKFNNILYSTFINNTAVESGGAINGGLNNISSSIFVDNTAKEVGGAINGSNNKIIGSNFINNTAVNGGAIYNDGGTITIQNSALTQNKADNGGAVYSLSKLIINNSIIVNNNNSTSGVDIFIYYNYSDSISLNNNWWGINNLNWSNILNIAYTPDNHIIMTFTNSSIPENNTLNLTVSLNTLNDTKTYIKGLPERFVTFSSMDPNGTFTNNNTYFIEIVNSIFTGDYNTTLKAYIDNEELTLNLKKNTKLSLDIQPLIISPTRTVKVTPNLIPADATGNIDYYIDNTYYKTGNTKETISITGLTIGKHNITGIYLGDNKYITSSTTTYFSVESDVTFTVDVVTQPFYIGDNITVVPYLPVNATGSITYILNGKIITITDKIHENKTINELPLGEHILIASYSGDTQYVESVVTTNFTINKISTTILIDPITAQPGDTIQIIANITNIRNKEVTGFVAFKLNGHTIGKQNITNGKAILEYKIPNNYSAKNYTITVVYGKTDKFQSSTTNTTLTILKKETITKVQDIQTYKNTTTQLTATITDTQGNNITGGFVKFKLNEKTLPGQVSVIKGVAIYNYTIPKDYSSKNYTITAVYTGTNNYDQSRANGTLTILKTKAIIETTPITCHAGETINIKTNITDINGNKLNTGEIIYKLNGKTLKDSNQNTIKTKVINGQTTQEYKIPDNYSAKEYKLTIVYSDKNHERTQQDTTLTIEKEVLTNI